MVFSVSDILVHNTLQTTFSLIDVSLSAALSTVIARVTQHVRLLQTDQRCHLLAVADSLLQCPNWRHLSNLNPGCWVSHDRQNKGDIVEVPQVSYCTRQCFEPCATARYILLQCSRVASTLRNRPCPRIPLQ